MPEARAGPDTGRRLAVYGPRTTAHGGVPVRWTTHFWRPEQLTALLAGAGLEAVAELRLPPTPTARPQVVLAARRPAATDAGRPVEFADGRSYRW